MAYAGEFVALFSNSEFSCCRIREALSRMMSSSFLEAYAYALVHISALIFCALLWPVAIIFIVSVYAHFSKKALRYIFKCSACLRLFSSSRSTTTTACTPLPEDRRR